LEREGETEGRYWRRRRWLFGRSREILKEAIMAIVQTNWFSVCAL